MKIANIQSIKNPIVRALKKRSVLKQGGQVFEFKNGMILYKQVKGQTTTSSLFKDNKLFKETKTSRFSTDFLPNLYHIKLHTTTNFNTNERKAFSTIIDFGKLDTNPQRKKLNISTDICFGPLEGDFDRHNLYMIDDGKIIHKSSVSAKSNNTVASNNTVQLSQDLLDLYNQHSDKVRSVWAEDLAAGTKIYNEMKTLAKAYDEYVGHKLHELWAYSMERLGNFPFN